MDTFFNIKAPGEKSSGVLFICAGATVCNQNATKRLVSALNKGFTWGSNPMSSADTGNKVL